MTRHAARCALIAACLAAAPLMSGGCASAPNQKAEAHARWNAARAGTLAQLATDQLEAGQLDEARETIDQAIKVDATLPGVHLLSARIALEEDDLKGASASLLMCERLLPAPPVAAEMNHLAGTIAGRWQQPEEAVRRHSTASRLAPQDATYLVAYAEALVDADAAEEAHSVLSARLHEFQGEAAIFDALGQVSRVLGRPREAAEMFRRASIYAPEDESIRERHALSLLAAGQPETAARVLAKVIDASPNEALDRPSLHVALGEAHLQSGNAEAAEASFVHATRGDRRSFQAWIGLAKARLMADRTEAALMAAERAVALSDETTRDDARLLRGLTNVRLGEYRAAASDLHGLAGSGDELAADLYALCLLGLGDERGARRAAGGSYANVSDAALVP